MKEFVFRHGQEIWPKNHTLWHVYLLPDLERDTELATLVQACTKVTSAFPITPVAPAWLHITVTQIPDAVGATTSPTAIDNLATAMSDTLRTVEPFTINIGSCLSYPSGAIFDISPDHDLDRLRRTVADTLARVRNQPPDTYLTGVPHLTLGYANGDADSDLYHGGQWALVSGKADDGEDVVTAVIRETHEEAGILLDDSDLTMAAVVHYRNFEGQPRVGFGFHARHDPARHGPVVNAEPHKCDRLDWFPANGPLPEPLERYTAAILATSAAAIPISVAGWPPRPTPQTDSPTVTRG